MRKKILFFVSFIFFSNLIITNLFSDEKSLIPLKKYALSKKEIKEKSNILMKLSGSKVQCMSGFTKTGTTEVLRHLKLAIKDNIISNTKIYDKFENNGNFKTT